MNTTGTEYVYEFRDLSTRAKPIGSNCVNNTVDFPIAGGSVFFEIDTSKVWMLALIENTTGDVTTYTGKWMELK